MNDLNLLSQNITKAEFIDHLHRGKFLDRASMGLVTLELTGHQVTTTHHLVDLGGADMLPRRFTLATISQAVAELALANGSPAARTARAADMSLNIQYEPLAPTPELKVVASTAQVDWRAATPQAIMITGTRPHDESSVFTAVLHFTLPQI